MAEHLTVDQVVVGSTPISHPYENKVTRPQYRPSGRLDDQPGVIGIIYNLLGHGLVCGK